MSERLPAAESPHFSKPRHWAPWLLGALCLAAGCGSSSATAVDAAAPDAAAHDAATADAATPDAARPDAAAPDAATPDAATPDAAVASVDGWQISAAPATFTPGNAAAGATASASFTAQGSGLRAYGACLTIDIHGGKPCVTAADCGTGALVPLVTGYSLYCEAALGQAQKTCWTRNGADVDWCNKVPPPGRAAGTFNTPAVDAAQLAGTGSMTRWMALACLNAGTYPTFSDGPKPPCASSDAAADSYKVYATSAVSTFTAP